VSKFAYCKISLSVNDGIANKADKSAKQRIIVFFLIFSRVWIYPELVKKIVEAVTRCN